MKNVLLLSFIVIGFIANGQSILGNESFPYYTPFLNEEDTILNARNYYVIDSTFVEVSCANLSCQESRYYQSTQRYNFDQGRTAWDGNSTMDVYYSANHNTSLSPNGKPLAVLLHGNGGSKDNWKLKLLGNRLVERGYAVIIPDYTTSLDDRWSDGEDICFSERQLNYIMQYAVRDVRAAIRRMLYLASTPMSDVHVDHSQIYIVGTSFGAVTTTHVAYYEADEFPSGSVVIENTSYTFSTDLDDVNICGDTTYAPCAEFEPSTDYDPRDYINGIALLSPFVLDTNAIDSSDSAAPLIFHGTCDPIVPFDSPSVKERSYRKEVYHNGGEFVDPTSAPCADIAVDYVIYGGLDVFRRVKNLSPSLYHGFFRICQKDHGLGRDYLFRLHNNTVHEGLATYEILRFFSNVLNGDKKKSFQYNLDHGQHPFADSAYMAMNCNSVLQYSDTLYVSDSVSYYPKGDPNPHVIFLARWVCPTCEIDYEGTIRYPYFGGGTNDYHRYMELSLPNCPEELIANNEEIEIYHSSVVATSVAIFDRTGKQIKNIGLKEKSQKVSTMLIRELNLSDGIYFLHFDNGERQTIVIR